MNLSHRDRLAIAFLVAFAVAALAGNQISRLDKADLRPGTSGRPTPSPPSANFIAIGSQGLTPTVSLPHPLRPTGVTGYPPVLVVPSYPQHIPDEQTAIQRAMGEIGHEVPSGDSVARLVDFATAERWCELTLMASSPSSPAWIVGIAGSDVLERLVLSDPGYYQPTGYQPPSDSFAGDGAYIILDANGGHVKSVGALRSGTNQTIESIRSLPNQVIKVVPATLLPPAPTSAPDDFNLP